MAYTWNEGAGRFVDGRGRFVAESRVRAVVDDVADAASARMQTASEALLDGRMSLGAWQAEAQQVIKLSHSAAAVLAHGGAEAMTPSHWGAIGPVVRDQYQYLRDFAAQVADGRQPLNGSLMARARQYGQASRVTFETTYSRGQHQRGFRFERNVLGSAEHCRVCPDLTARGWVQIGSLPPIGSRPCRAQDRCRIAYARTVEGEQAA